MNILMRENAFFRFVDYIFLYDEDKNKLLKRQQINKYIFFNLHTANNLITDSLTRRSTACFSLSYVSGSLFESRSNVGRIV